MLSVDGHLNFPFKISGWVLEDPCFDHTFPIYLLGELQLPYLKLEDGVLQGGDCCQHSE